LLIAIHSEKAIPGPALGSYYKLYQEKVRNLSISSCSQPCKLAGDFILGLL